ncbi:MAG: hypothetical protein DWQ29_01270 [Planctomycetota bacterium]|nr:MAG: hypothetical protein DWQ29_01270 [Planctomycetota bacterium]
MRVDSRDVFFLWFTDEVDGVVLEAGNLVTFSTLQECIDFAETRHLDLGSRESTVVAIDQARDWIEHFETSPVDARVLLNTWNMLEDYLRSRGSSGESFPLGENDLYEKLFFANNLPSITPSGQKFAPDWSLEEKQRIVAALKQPLSEFHAALLR